jgi:hypothetical protein
MSEAYAETKARRAAREATDRDVARDAEEPVPARELIHAVVATYPTASLVALLAAGYVVGRFLARR